jgi:hypothetical protein
LNSHLQITFSSIAFGSSRDLKGHKALIVNIKGQDWHLGFGPSLNHHIWVQNCERRNTSITKKRKSLSEHRKTIWIITLASTMKQVQCFRITQMDCSNSNLGPNCLIEKHPTLYSTCTLSAMHIHAVSMLAWSVYGPSLYPWLLAPLT